MVRSRVILLALAVALPAAVGCGDGGDDEPESSTTGTGSEMTQPGGSSAAVPDACTLLESSEVSARVGRPSTPEKRGGETLDGFALSQCEWEGPDGEVAVAVIGSPKRFEEHRDRGRGEMIPGIGDGAILEQGTSLEDRGGTSGRTVFIADGDRTLVVALARGDEEVPADDVVGLARTAHRRLP